MKAFIPEPLLFNKILELSSFVTKEQAPSIIMLEADIGYG